MTSICVINFLSACHYFTLHYHHHLHLLLDVLYRATDSTTSTELPRFPSLDVVCVVRTRHHHSPTRACQVVVVVCGCQVRMIIAPSHFRTIVVDIHSLTLLHTHMLTAMSTAACVSHTYPHTQTRKFASK